MNTFERLQELRYRLKAMEMNANSVARALDELIGILLLEHAQK